MTNPFEDALHFVLHDILRRGDGPASAQAQKHIEALDAEKAKDASEPVHAPAAGAPAPLTPAPAVQPPAAASALKQTAATDNSKEK